MVEEFYTPLIDLSERFSKWKQFRKDINTKLRLFYLECRRNLELLNVLDLTPDNDSAVAVDEDYFSIIKNLETEILEMIFLEGKQNNKLYEILIREVEIQEIEQGFKVKKKGIGKIKKKKIKVIQACIYLYVKIATLKKLITIIKKGKALKKIYYRIRLNNLKTNFINIIKILSQNKEIREIITE